MSNQSNQTRKAWQMQLDQALAEHEELTAHLENHRSQMAALQEDAEDLTYLPLDRLTIAPPNLGQLQKAEKEIERRLRESTIKVMGIRRELARIDVQPLLKEHDGLAADLYVMMQDMERHILRMNGVMNGVEATYAEAGMTMAEASPVSYYKLLRLLQHSMATVQIRNGQRYSHDQIAAPVVGRLWVDESGRTEIVSREEYDHRLEQAKNKTSLPFRIPAMPFFR